MAKFVCDFSQVTSIGEKLCTAATDIETSISGYASQIESDLSSWSGSAKSSFQTTCNSQVETAKASAEYINNLGEFIKQASQNIESLDGELAALEI